jgi:hypothetical protein
MYEKQTYPSSKRKLNKSFDILFGTEKLFEEINSKYFKAQYAGQPTKRYKMIWGKIQEGSVITLEGVFKHLQ